jgi:hypothetical protein
VKCTSTKTGKKRRKQRSKSAVDILSGASGNVGTQKLVRIGKGGDKPLAVHILSGTSCKCTSLKTGKNRQRTGDKPLGVHIILSSCSSSGRNSFNCCCSTSLHFPVTNLIPAANISVSVSLSLSHPHLPNPQCENRFCNRSRPRSFNPEP